MSNSVDSDQPCFTKVHNWLARLRFRDRARPEPKWPLVTRLLGEPLFVGGNYFGGGHLGVTQGKTVDAGDQRRTERPIGTATLYTQIEQ
jgi:hypothetical protein